jgi:hypothetical protein
VDPSEHGGEIKRYLTRGVIRGKRQNALRVIVALGGARHTISRSISAVET